MQQYFVRRNAKRHARHQAGAGLVLALAIKTLNVGMETVNSGVRRRALMLRAGTEEGRAIR